MDVSASITGIQVIYDDKITRQKFDCAQIAVQLKSLLSYQCDALHWNGELTSDREFSINVLPVRLRERIRLLKTEAENNHFYVLINGTNINQYKF